MPKGKSNEDRETMSGNLFIVEMAEDSANVTRLPINVKLETNTVEVNSGDVIYPKRDHAVRAIVEVITDDLGSTYSTDGLSKGAAKAVAKHVEGLRKKVAQAVRAQITKAGAGQTVSISLDPAEYDIEDDSEDEDLPEDQFQAAE
jgi:hypothetical protein